MSETESDLFAPSDSAYELTSLDETSDPDVAGPSSRKRSPKKKLVFLQKRPTMSTSSDESLDEVLTSLKNKYPKKKRTSLEKQTNIPGESTEDLQDMLQADPQDEPTLPITKNRKSPNPAAWKRNIKKKAIAEGKMYTNWKGVQKGPRSTGTNCNCRYKCFQNVDEETRNTILEKFNKIGDRNLQNTYLGGLIQTTSIQRVRKKTNERPGRTCSHMYFVRLGQQSKRVCRHAFGSIHGISRKRVDQIAQTFRSRDIAAQPSNKGKHKNRPNRKSQDILQNLTTHIKSFPRRESHYSRNKSRRFYLSPDLSIKKMHELYLELYEPECAGNPEYKPKVPYDFYFRFFKENFNYSFGAPRSDTCKKCDVLHTKLKDMSLDESERKELELERQNHVVKADLFFKELKEKTALCKHNDEVEVLTFDFQQNLPLPKVPVGEAFYKRQLWTYNFCIHSGKTNKAHFYLYDETTARKSPNEVVSFLYHYITNILPQNVTILYLFSDNAAAQNKNSTMVQFLYLLVRTMSIKKVVHRFPEPGHSFLPCDRCFGVIEKFLRRKDYVFSPQQYADYIKQAAKQFIPILVKQNMILNFSTHFDGHFKKVILSANKQRFQISKYRIFEYSKEHLNHIRVSVSTGLPIFIEFQILRDLQSNIQMDVAIPVYSQPIPLKKVKYVDVMQLATRFVPVDQITFYNRLTSEALAVTLELDNVSATEDDDQADE